MTTITNDRKSGVDIMNAAMGKFSVQKYFTWTSSLENIIQIR